MQICKLYDIFKKNDIVAVLSTGIVIFFSA